MPHYLTFLRSPNNINYNHVLEKSDNKTVFASLETSTTDLSWNCYSNYFGEIVSTVSWLFCRFELYDYAFMLCLIHVKAHIMHQHSCTVYIMPPIKLLIHKMSAQILMHSFTYLQLVTKLSLQLASWMNKVNHGKACYIPCTLYMLFLTMMSGLENSML